MKGVCTGEVFVKVRSKHRYGGYLRKKKNCTFKTKDKTLDYCPKCGYALYWSKDGKVPYAFVV